MKRGQTAILREEWVAVCNDDLVKALLLERIIWNGRASYGGWVSRSSAKLSASIMMGSSDRTIRRKISTMIRDGILEGNGNRIRPVYDTIRKLAASKEFIVNERNWNPDEEWDEMCKIVDERDAKEHDKAEQTELSLATVESIAGYCRQHKQLDSAPDFARAVSWHLWDVCAIEPYGSGKQWIAACSDLWEAAGGNDNVLKNALVTGNTVRMQRGLTLSGPRSFVKFALDAKSRYRLQERGYDVNGTESGDRGQRLYGQRIDDGKIKLGKA